jgi:hypothetical protein
MDERSGSELMRRCWRVWRWSFPLGAMFALLAALRDFTAFRSGGSSLSLGYWVAGELMVFAFWSFFAPLILLVMQRFPITRATLVRSSAVHLVFYVALACLYTVHYWATDRMLAPERTGPLAKNFVWTFYVAASGAMIKYYAPILVGGYIAIYYARLREQELRSATLATELAQAQLRALKMQLQPHFLFNTLHSISTLVHTNAKGADRMIAQLSDLLRAALNAGAVEFVPLRQELDLAEKYLAIEQTRFSDRLVAEFDVAAETLEMEVPYLILQPIVENAVRHGISKNVGAGKIVVRARAAGERLNIGVTDNGPGFAKTEGNEREGVGLKNTRARLEQAYPGRFELRMSRAGERGTVVELILPSGAGNENPAGEAHLSSGAPIPPHIAQGA